MRKQFEIVDENGNRHGPFANASEIAAYVESRSLGEERDSDDERAGGWTARQMCDET